jgi:hypothetical protein
LHWAPPRLSEVTPASVLEPASSGTTSSSPVIARVRSGWLAGAGPIGVEVGKVISRYKTGKHFVVTITGTTLTVERRQDLLSPFRISPGHEGFSASETCR